MSKSLKYPFIFYFFKKDTWLASIMGLVTLAVVLAKPMAWPWSTLAVGLYLFFVFYLKKKKKFFLFFIFLIKGRFVFLLVLQGVRDISPGPHTIWFNSKP
jgi:hypothetical protein